ncbi:MAG TPA: M55 family metallopeptidase [Gemmatimonadota bacterium]|jgi:D-amino peptidase
MPFRAAATLVVVLAAGAALPARALGQGAGTPTPTPGAPGAGQPGGAAVAERDTTPASAVFGVTEYELARRKLEEELDPEAFTVYIVADMEGLAGAVMNATEMRPVYRGGHPTHERFREELTDEVNAAIEGAREAGATRFVVNDGHGGTLFRNTLPEKLDPEALLIRGYPKPIVMTTGMNPRVDAIFIVGAHANAGTQGVISHNFAFDSFTIDGRVLNEAGIAAFHGGEMGVPLALATGDDVLVAETKEMLGPIETVTVKQAYGRSAAAGWSPEKVRGWIREAAGRAVRRVKAGEIRPLRLDPPYEVAFCTRKTYEPWVAEAVGRLEGVQPGDGAGCFRYTSDSAEEVGNLLNEIEWVVLKP